MPYSPAVRPSRTVAVAVLSAALALGALPGLAGSREPSHARPIGAAVFRDVLLAATGIGPQASIGPLDDAQRSAGHLDPGSAFGATEPAAVEAPPERPTALAPAVPNAWDWKPPRYTMSGYATFYDNGTTAMRLPRGTIVVVCGDGGCLERVVNDYGPQKPERIIDLYRPDFFAICGCGWWYGVVWVTVSVY